MPNSNSPRSFWWRLVNLNPALVRGLVMAIVMVLGSAGILVSDAIADGLVGAWVAIMAVVQALWTERGTEPKAKVAVTVPDPVNAPDVVAPGGASTTAQPSEIVEAAYTSAPQK